MMGVSAVVSSAKNAVSSAAGAIQPRTAIRARDGHRILVFIVTREQAEGEADLLEVVDAVDALGLGLGLGERGEEHRRQNRDDRDHNEQLDKRKRFNLSEVFHLDFLVYGFSNRTHCLTRAGGFGLRSLRLAPAVPIRKAADSMDIYSQAPVGVRVFRALRVKITRAGSCRSRREEAHFKTGIRWSLLTLAATAHCGTVKM
jgi:hypothetical protein